MVNRILRAILIHLINKKYIGKRHTPEEKLIKSKTKWVSKKEKDGFEKEYKKIINEGIILRLKKKTGKGSQCHISLNPRKLKDAYNLIR